MYSDDNEKICAYCVHSTPEKGTLTYLKCEKHGGYVPCSRAACEYYDYDIFKRPVRRKRKPDFSEFSKEQFSLDD